MKRVAPENSTDPHESAVHRSVALKGLNHVGRTARIIPASRGQKRTERHLIGAHAKNEQPTHVRSDPAMRSVADSTAAANCSNVASYVSRRARTSTSFGPIRGSIRTRTSSRRRRLSLFRSTAELPYRATTTAARAMPLSESRWRMSINGERCRLPERARRAMSPLRVMRRSREKPRPGSDASVLAGDFYRQALAAFFATTAQCGAAPPRFHAREKTVRADAALVAGAVGGLSHTNLFKRGEKREERRAESLRTPAPLSSLAAC